MDQELKNINTRLDNVMTFLEKNMLTKQELQDLTDELPTRADFSQLQNSVDGNARLFKNHDDELEVLGHRTSRMETWIKEAADKIGLKYRQ